MNISTLSQPETQLGTEIDAILNEEVDCSKITFVSAFASIRTVLRLRERLLEKAESGTLLRIVVGIDLGGTSREVLEELLRWDCETYVFHNTIPRSTFHPKIYLFESEARASLFIGSNNLTDGGFYTNYEAATRYDFEFPEDDSEYGRITQSLSAFLEPDGVLAQPLTTELLQALIQRGQLPSEAEARRSRRTRVASQQGSNADLPENPFSPVSVPLPPLLPRTIRNEEPSPDELGEPELDANDSATDAAEPPSEIISRPEGVLVWRKILPKTDALRVEEGSHHVGGVRLTQARFESRPGHRIDQTTYFRQLFADQEWEPELGRARGQEHTFIPMRIVIRGHDYGVRNFEISHKPSGEAGQANYTTILRWGRDFNSTIYGANLTGTTFSLYEISESYADFLIEITE